MEYIEQWGALGVFIASVIPFLDAIAMVPLGIAFGLDPFWTVIAAGFIARCSRKVRTP